MSLNILDQNDFLTCPVHISQCSLLPFELQHLGIMDSVNSSEVESPYKMLLMAAISIPVSDYLLGLLLVLMVFLYNFLEMHFLQDMLTGFKGQPVWLTFNPSSKLYEDVVSKCRILHGRYLSTPWLCSPHLQTVFLSYFGNAPAVKYRRQLYTTDDGGTVSLDWAIGADVMKPTTQVNDAPQLNDRNPIVMIIPGLASHSNSSYVKHFAFKMAKSGRNVVVINHRGFGGVSLTSDWFYHGGWSGDIRAVLKHLKSQYPEAPIFLLGTSIGANMLIFYLGEDGIDVPIVGAAAICCPWDPLLCDRFLSRRITQNIYSKAIATSLRVYANLHKAVISRISNWEGIEKTRYIRDFDNSAFRILAKCETVDTYYRRGCSINVLGNVRVPLLCISSLDDPICTSEAIPWDECRLNENVVLATTHHGGHLPHFEGLRGTSLWWVRAVDEFFSVLQSSSSGNWKKEVHVPVSLVNDLKSSITQSPIVNVSNDGLVIETVNLLVDGSVLNHGTMEKHNGEDTICEEGNDLNQLTDMAHSPKQDSSEIVVAPYKKSLTRLSLWNQKSLWLLLYRTMSTTWPFLGVAFALFFRKKFKKLFSTNSLTM